MKQQLIENINRGVWGYAYKGYYIVPNYGRYHDKVKWYDFYTTALDVSEPERIYLAGNYQDYTTLDYAKSFITWRIEDALRDYEQNERNNRLNK